MKGIAIFLSSTIVALMLLTGCSGVSEQDYNMLLSENESIRADLDAAIAQSDNLQSELELVREQNELLKLKLDVSLTGSGTVDNTEQSRKVEAIITGGFSATFLGSTNDTSSELLDDNFVILNMFQSYPFVLYVGPEIASSLEVGEVYYFDISEVSVGMIDAGMIGHGIPPITALDDYGLFIESFRLATDDEIGLASPSIYFDVNLDLID